MSSINARDAMNFYTTAEIVEQIRAHARSLGMTPAQLCRAAGVADSTYRRWRLGEFRPKQSTVEKLLRFRKGA